MASIKVEYGTKTNITITLASLTDGSSRSSTAVDNGTDLFMDALVQLKITVGTGSTATSHINVYAFGSADDGTTYSDDSSGTDSAETLVVPPNARLIGVINCPTASTAFESHPMSVAAAFGGTLPEDWGIIVENQSDTTLDSTEGNHLKFYKGIKAQSA